MTDLLNLESPTQPAPKERKRQTHPESALQRGVKRAVSRAVACQHEFACHDRNQENKPGSHIYEKNRGLRRSWPDTELAYTEGRTFRCELKKPGWTPPGEHTVAFQHWRDQRDLAARLTALGHVTRVATSVFDYLTHAHQAGVPLLPNWQFVARHEDELVASDILKQEIAAGAPRKASKPRAPKASAGRIRKIEAIRGRRMF